MLLRNYYWGMVGNLSFSEDSNFFLTSTAGGKSYGYTPAGLITLCQIGNRMRSISKSKQSGGVCFGTGRKAITLDDYFLSGNLITSLSGTSVISYEHDTTNNLITVTGVYTVTNGSSDNAVVGEMGVIANIRSDYYLIDRTLLDEPITIPPGEIAKITYTIKFAYPNPD